MNLTYFWQNLEFASYSNSLEQWNYFFITFQKMYYQVKLETGQGSLGQRANQASTWLHKLWHYRTIAVVTCTHFSLRLNVRSAVYMESILKQSNVIYADTLNRKMHWHTQRSWICHLVIFHNRFYLFGKCIPAVLFIILVYPGFLHFVMDFFWISHYFLFLDDLWVQIG